MTMPIILKGHEGEEEENKEEEHEEEHKEKEIHEVKKKRKSVNMKRRFRAKMLAKVIFSATNNCKIYSERWVQIVLHKTSNTPWDVAM